MVPFFIIEILMGLAKAAIASWGSDCAKAAPNSGDMLAEGLSVVCAIPLLALNHKPVPLTVGKYLVKASLRCCWAASTPYLALRMAKLFCRAESFICSKV